MQEIKIFISSPGDVQAERGMVDQVIERLQGDYWNFVRLEPVLWEYEATRAVAHFNEEIIAPAECDIVLSFLWTRLGSRMPPQFTRADGSRFESGTEWEIVTAAEAHERTGRPDLMVYRRFEQPPLSENAARRAEGIEQRAKLERFWAEWFQNSDGTIRRAFVAYHDAHELAPRLTEQLRKLIHRRLPASVPAYDVFRPEALPPGSPFRGLHAFGFEDAPLFFGRSRAIAGIARQLEAQATAENGVGPFVLILGGSGSGKSSLARAGVGARLTHPNTVSGVGVWRRADFHPSAVPGQSPLGVLASTVAAALPELSAQVLGEHVLDAVGLAVVLADPEWLVLLDGPLRAAFAVAAATVPGGGAARLFLVVDQLEELFTDRTVTGEGREEFVRALAFLAGTRAVWIAATMRSEFFARAIELPALRLLMRGEGSFTLLPPDAGEISQIVRYPAAAANLAFERHPQTGESLADAIHAEASRDARALPLLEFLLQDLYEHRDENNVLLWNRYEEVGKLAGALVSHADAALGQIREGSERCALEAIFLSLVTIDDQEQAVPTRNRAPRASLERLEGGARVLDVFIAARLFVTDSEEARPVVSLAHEALLAHWPYLQEFVKKHGNLLRSRRRLADLCSRWREKADYDPKGAARLLLDEGSLAEAQEVVLFNPPDLTDTERDFVGRSVSKSQKRLRRLKAAVAVFAVLAVLASGAGGVAWWQQRVATAQRARAETREAEALAANQKTHAQIHQAVVADLASARGLLDKGNWREALPYLHRAQTYDDPLNQLAGSFLWSTVVYGTGNRDALPERFLPYEGRVEQAVFSPDGQTVLGICADGAARRWNVRTGQLVGEPLRQKDGITRAAFSPGGMFIVTSGSGEARAWDGDTGAPLGRPMPHPGEVVSIQFGENEFQVLTVSRRQIAHPSLPGTTAPEGGTDAPAADGSRKSAAQLYAGLPRQQPNTIEGSAQLWDPSTGEPLGEPMRHDGGQEMYQARFDRDGRRILTTGADKTVRAWSASDGHPLATLMNGVDGLERAVFNPDGKRLMTVSGDTAQRHDVATGQPSGPIMRNKGEIQRALFCPNGEDVLTIGADKKMWQWLDSGGESHSYITAHEDNVEDLSFSPEGERALTVVGDTVRLYSQPPDFYASGDPLRHDRGVSHAVFSPDGLRVLTAGEGGAWLWKVPVGRPEGEPMHTSGAETRSVAYSADGRRIVVGSDSGCGIEAAARVWDVAAGRWLTPRLLHDGTVHHVAVNHDGSRFATACRGTVRLWDGSTGQPVGEAMVHPYINGIKVLSFSPDGARVLTACEDAVQCWDAATGHPAGAPLHHGKQVLAAVFSPDGTRLATAASEDRAARLWDARTGRSLGEPMGHRDAVASVVFSPDGTRVLTASLDHTARLWDAFTGKSLGEPWRHPTRVEHVAFNHDGTQAVLAGSDEDRLGVPTNGVTQIWNAATGQPCGESMIFPSAVTTAAFNRDGSRVLVCAWGPNTGLWDAATGRPAALTLGRAEHAVFSPDGTRVFIAGESKFADDHIRECAPSALPSVPGWMETFVQTICGERFDANGDLRALTMAERLAGRELLRGTLGAGAGSQPPAGSWERLADWILADETARRVSPTSDFTVAEVARREGEYEKSREALRFAPGDPFVYLAFAAKMVRDAPYYRAELHLARAALLQNHVLQHLPPGNPGACLRIARELREQKRPELALRALGEASPPVGPLPVGVPGLRARCLQDLKRFREAGVAYDEVLASPEKTADDCVQAAQVANQLGTPDRALELAQEATALDPASPAARRLLAACLQKADRRAEALDAYLLVLPSLQATSGDFTQAGYLAAQLQAADQADEIFRRAEERFPKYADIPRMKGWAFLNLKSPTEALAAFRRSDAMMTAARRVPLPDLLAGLVVAEWLTGEKIAAVADCQRLIDTDAKYTDAAKVQAFGWPDSETQPLLAAIAEAQRHRQKLASKQTR